MKKTGIVLFGIVGAVFANTASAVQKCVALTSSTTCTYVSTAYNQSNWSSNCGGISIQGVAFCGSKSGSIGDKSDAVTASSTSDDNKYCWCKMVSPAVSYWVFNNAGPSAGFCANSCAYYCANVPANSSAFRSALFTSLGD